MEIKNPWPLLREGKKRGLELRRQAYAQKPTPSHTMELGVVQAEYYTSLMKFGGKDPPAFKESMRKISDTSQPGWQDEDVFSARIWHEEFFLAGYEAVQR